MVKPERGKWQMKSRNKPDDNEEVKIINKKKKTSETRTFISQTTKVTKCEGDPQDGPQWNEGAQRKMIWRAAQKQTQSNREQPM